MEVIPDMQKQNFVHIDQVKPPLWGKRDIYAVFSMIKPYILGKESDD